MTTLVFVYGTLKRGFSANYKLGTGAKLKGTTHIPGVLVALGGFPGLVEDEVCQVIGEVYEIDEARLGDLDGYEGVHRGMYIRRTAKGPFGDMFYYEYVRDLPLTDHLVVAKHGEWKNTTYYPIVAHTWSYKEEKQHWAQVKGQGIETAEVTISLKDPTQLPFTPTELRERSASANPDLLCGVRAALARVYGPNDAHCDGEVCSIDEPEEVPPLSLPKVGTF